jgi:hypothetical protein
MNLQLAISVLLASSLSACPHRLQETVPTPERLPKALLQIEPVARLVSLNVENDLWSDHNAAPDGSYVVELVGDQSWLLRHQTGFVGVLLRNPSSGLNRQLFTLWEVGVGSGPIINVEWSTDSQAVRLVGSTQGFKRSQREATVAPFDLLFTVRDERVYDLRQTRTESSRGGSQSNCAVNATVLTLPRALDDRKEADTE